MAKKTASGGGRTRTVVRSAKTGRFVKKGAAKRRPKAVVVEQVKVSGNSIVEVARSTKTGRFVKKATAKRHPQTTSIARVKR
jgi:signal recognition particle subunit SEC65